MFVFATGGRALSDSETILHGEVLAPEAKAQEKTVRGRFWRTVKRAARQIPFIDDVAAAYYCAIDRTTPARVRTTLLGALAYFVLPVDLIPDFIIGTGFADDVTVLFGAITLVRAHIRPEHREAAREALDKHLG